MYNHWTTPTSARSPAAPPDTVGARLLPPATAETVTVALIGSNSDWADAVREQLYAMHWEFGELSVTDYGNLRRSTTDFVLPFLRELHSVGTVPVLIGDLGEDLARAQYLAPTQQEKIGFARADQYVRLSHGGEGQVGERLLDAAVHRNRPPRYHLTHIGAQRHLTSPATSQLLQTRRYEQYNLGEARADIANLEPSLRDAEVVQLDVGVIVHSEAPGQQGFNPSGFTLQEACQLSYYGGNSDRLRSFGLFGARTDSSLTDTARQLTAAAYAQLLWYFLHGLSLRVGDFPATTTGMVEYLVEAHVPERLVFWRSPRSNRWWIEVSNHLVACSYEDYLSSSKSGKLTDRIAAVLQRY